MTIASKVLSVLNKGASADAGEVTHVNEAKTAEQALSVLAKEARTALREAGIWKQEFHGNEIVAVIACFIASKEAIDELSAESIKNIANEDGCSLEPTCEYAEVVRSRGNYWTVKQIQVRFKVGREEAKEITIKLIKSGVLEMIPDGHGQYRVIK